MRLLLDTCTFLWIASNSPELSERAKQTFSLAENDVFLSSVSVWEILVKQKLGRLPLPTRPELFVQEMRQQHGIESLPLTEDATFYLNRLPSIHRDPFDRMLICQALAEGLTLLTPDSSISEYPVPTRW